MKAKVKNNRKDINIDIVIENNLLSKNKIKQSDKENESFKEQKKLVKPSNSAPINNNMSRLLSEYFGVIAQRDLYRQNTTPFSLQQYINPTPQNQPIVQNIGGGNTQQEQNDDDEYEEEYLNNTTVIEPEAGEEVEAPSTQPPQAAITKQMLINSIIDDPDEEKEFVNQKSNEWKARRQNLVDSIIENPSMYLKKIDVIQFKLGRYVQLYRPNKWKRMMNSSQ